MMTAWRLGLCGIRFMDTNHKVSVYVCVIPAYFLAIFFFHAAASCLMFLPDQLYARSFFSLFY